MRKDVHIGKWVVRIAEMGVFAYHRGCDSTFTWEGHDSWHFAGRGFDGDYLHCWHCLEEVPPEVKTLYNLVKL